jgi:hypothetical protein
VGELPAGVEPDAVAHRVIVVGAEPVLPTEACDPAGDALPDAHPPGEVVHVVDTGRVAGEAVLDPPGL